jgi:hypothetical protein
MQGFHFVALRKVGVIADVCFRKYVSSVTVCENTTTHRANDDQLILLYWVLLYLCLWESGPETWHTSRNESKAINYVEMSSKLTDIKYLRMYYLK